MAKNPVRAKASTKSQLLAVKRELKSDVKQLGQELRQEIKSMEKRLLTHLRRKPPASAGGGMRRVGDRP